MNSPLRIEYLMHFRRSGRRAGVQMQLGTDPPLVARPRLPRLARLMALALRFEHLIRTGAVKDQTMLAQLGNVSRARISQIMKLVHLAPPIQEALLYLPAIERGRAPIILADLLPIAAQVDWGQQRTLWRSFCARRKMSVSPVPNEIPTKR